MNFAVRNNSVANSWWKSSGENDRSLPAEHARVRASACEPTGARASEQACARLQMIVESDEAREQV